MLYSERWCCHQTEYWLSLKLILLKLNCSSKEAQVKAAPVKRRASQAADDGYKRANIMAKLSIEDLPESRELDRKAMAEVIGGSRSSDHHRRPELNRRNGAKQRLLRRLKRA